MDNLYVFPYLSGGLGHCLFQLYYAKYYSEVNGLELKLIKQNDCESQALLLKLFPLKVIPVPQSYTTLTYGENCFKVKPILTSVSSNIELRGTPMCYTYCSHTNLFPNWKNALMKASIQILEDANLINDEMQKNTWMLAYNTSDMDAYYRQCIDEIPDGKRLHVFCNTNRDCKTVLANLTKGRNIIVTYSNESEPLNALYEMTYCLGGSITDNEALSWWGAFYARKRAFNFGSKNVAYYPEACGCVPHWGKVIKT
jgi:hypothetical protein